MGNEYKDIAFLCKSLEENYNKTLIEHEGDFSGNSGASTLEVFCELGEDTLKTTKKIAKMLPKKKKR